MKECDIAIFAVKIIVEVLKIDGKTAQQTQILVNRVRTFLSL